jgi:hypothetical protein
MNFDSAGFLLALASLIATLGGTWVVLKPSRPRGRTKRSAKWTIIVGSCAVLAMLAIAGIVFGFVKGGSGNGGSSSATPTRLPTPTQNSPSNTPTVENPEPVAPTTMNPYAASNPEPNSSSSPNPASNPNPAPARPGPEACAIGDEVQLDFQKNTSGLDIPFAAEVKCPVPAGRTYVLIVELNFEDGNYYYPKQEIVGTSGAHPGSIGIVGSRSNTTRQIFVISIDRTQLPELRNTGPDGELVNWLPGSHKLASRKYSHTRTS